MEPDEIGKAYDQITHLWQHPDFNLNNGIAAHKRAIGWVNHRGQALDLGCGCTGRFIELLSNEGFQVTGLDVSDKMLRLAKKQQPQATFIRMDINDYSLGRYDFITAWDSLWHIALDKQVAIITKIVNSLSSGGVFIFSFGGTDQANFHYDDSMGPELYYSTLGTAGVVQLLISLGCIIRHLEFDQHPELHAYLIVEKS